ncbi:MAG TPA: hypothetical protein VMJ32_14925 [Pirellulales bacterium]|nr:hypothetical protein [Pirellulales bacterium]
MRNSNKRNLRRRLLWLLIVCGGLTLSNIGCGGDAYEKQFDDSLQHLKKTGLPLGQEPAPPADGAATGAASNPEPQQPPPN